MEDSKLVEESEEDDGDGDDEDEDEEEVVEEGDEFLKMVQADMLELTECLPMLSKEVQEGTELADTFLKVRFCTDGLRCFPDV